MKKPKSDELEDIGSAKYYVVLERKGASSVSLLISDRRDFMSQQHDSIEESASADPKDLIKQIASESASGPDYLLPDTPLKEATFRVLLAHKNKPMTAAQISEELGNRWSMSPYPRDLSPTVIERLLQHMDPYAIGRIAPPEAPETDE